MKRILFAMFASALILSACGGSDSGGSGSRDETSASAEFNDADVTFAQDMIPHHEQAVEMADLALDKADADEVKALAEQIKGAQDPEIQTMKGFLEDWGQKEGEEPDDMDDMGHSDDSAESGDASETGMMSDDEMADLEAASGAAFDKAFLEMMVEHHKGAISMSETERADGESADAKELAGQIIEAQEAEIAEMETLLSSES